MSVSASKVFETEYIVLLVEMVLDVPLTFKLIPELFALVNAEVSEPCIV